MHPSRSSPVRAYAGLLLTMVFWAGNSIVGRAVRGDVPPFTLAFGRWTLALVILAPFAIRTLRTDWPAARRHWRAILFLGLVGVAAFNGFLYSGLRDTTASNGLLLQALIPALVLLLGAIVFRDRVSGGQAIGVLVATIGVGVIVFRGDPAAVLRFAVGRGDGLILCGCVAWALYTACLRLRPAVHPASLLFLTFCIGSATMAPFSAHELRTTDLAWTPGVFAAFVYVAVFPSLCAYLLYNGAVERLGAGAAGQAISLLPLFGSLLAAPLLGEALHGYHAIGMAMILAGIVLGWSFAAPAPAEPLACNG